MAEWDRVELDLAEEGYSDFEFDSGETAVPGVLGRGSSGESNVRDG